MSELISSFALGFIVLTVGVWVSFWVFIGYFVAGAIAEDLNTGMIYAAALGPLGIALLLVGHYASPDSSAIINGTVDSSLEMPFKFPLIPMDDPLR